MCPTSQTLPSSVMHIWTEFTWLWPYTVPARSGRKLVPNLGNNAGVVARVLGKRQSLAKQGGEELPVDDGLPPRNQQRSRLVEDFLVAHGGGGREDLVTNVVVGHVEKRVEGKHGSGLRS